jgi:hypothetical protein
MKCDDLFRVPRRSPSRAGFAQADIPHFGYLVLSTEVSILRKLRTTIASTQKMAKPPTLAELKVIPNIETSVWPPAFAHTNATATIISKTHNANVSHTISV